MKNNIYGSIKRLLQNNYKKYLNRIALLSIVCSFSCLLMSCDSFLSDAPSKSTQLPIKSIDQLDALLGNFSIFYLDKNRSAILCTQDMALSTTLYGGMKSQIFSQEVIQGLTWDTEYLPLDGKEDAWSSEYGKIFQANLVLSYIDKVEGSAELKQQLSCEAHLIRAYSYFLLAQTYCLSYNESTKGEMGVPLKTSVDFQETADRGTLEQTYTLIEDDLKEALKANNPVIVGGKYRPWRGNRSAAKAFAARYYLYRGNYQQALQYANEALAEYSELFDYNTEMSYYDANYNVDGKIEVIKFPATYQYSYADMISFKEFYYSRTAYFAYGWLVPSEELLNLYNQEADLRYRYSVVEDFSITMDRSNMRYPGFVFMGQTNIPSGPTTSEMLLVKAESMARLGSWEQAMGVLEQLRQKRIETSKYVALSAANQQEAIMLILKERRMERPFVFTFYDNKRLNNNEVSYDDVSLTRQFYPYTSSAVQKDQPLVTYTLPKDSKKWARPIPYTEVTTSMGSIKQNEY